MTVSRVYLDTSAYLAVLLDDSKAPGITNFLKNKILCSSTLLLIESERNLVRLFREKNISELEFSALSKRINSDIPGFIFRDLTPEICLTKQFPLIKTPKTADLIHL